ncbi:MAG TPA: substrate-binding domain-containing protein [Williamwhitmania sp.]|nr:substrate-binding domain-containing protein [Williamwhitmania sp.]
MNLLVKIIAKTGIALALLLMMNACHTGSNKTYDETPTRGNIKITVDESYQPIIDAEIATFTSLYPYAKITPSYKPEVDVINDFMNDSVQVIVANKKLTDLQVKYLRDTQIVVRTTAFADDAIALIINKANRDTLLEYKNIQDIFLGKIKQWSQLDPKSRLGKIGVVFDNTKSSNVRYFKERFNITDSLPDNFYAMQTNEQVINYIARNKSAMGIISVNWISNQHDSIVRNFIERVNVVAVSQPYDNNSFYRPYQGSIYDKSYPFIREVYLISRETFVGLGSGFISWVAGDQGQRIILKSGLVPATMPIRLIQVKH